MQESTKKCGAPKSSTWHTLGFIYTPRGPDHLEDVLWPQFDHSLEALSPARPSEKEVPGPYGYPMGPKGIVTPYLLSMWPGIPKRISALSDQKSYIVVSPLSRLWFGGAPFRGSYFTGLSPPPGRLFFPPHRRVDPFGFDSVANSRCGRLGGGLSEGLGRGDVLAPHRSARERAGAEDARSAERAARGFWGVLCSFWSQQLGLCLDSHRCHALRPRVTLSTQCLGPPRTTAHRKSGVRSKTPAGRSQASAALSILCESDRGKSILAQTLVVAWMAEGGRGRPEKMTSHKRGSQHARGGYTVTH